MSPGDQVAAAAGQIIQALLVQIGIAVVLGVSVLAAMAGVLGYFIGWDTIRRAIDAEFAARYAREEKLRERRRKRFQRDHPGLALLFDDLRVRREDAQIMKEEEERIRRGDWYEDEWSWYDLDDKRAHADWQDQEQQAEDAADLTGPYGETLDDEGRAVCDWCGKRLSIGNTDSLCGSCLDRSWQDGSGGYTLEERISMQEEAERDDE